MTPKQKTVMTLAALLGTACEYYNYSLYGFSSKNIAQAFFPSADATSGLTATLAVFAVSYLAKPVGAMIFGSIGDRLGRTASLSITIIGMGIPTLVMGLMPSYASIGVVAPALIIAARFLQGIFLGGEYDGAAIYMLEHHGKLRSGYASALVRASGMGGLLLGAIAIAIATSLSDDYWRWPFLLSLPLMLVTVYFRRHMSETPEFVAYLTQKKAKAAHRDNKAAIGEMRDLLRTYWRRLLVAALIFGTFSGSLQYLVVFLHSYLPLVMRVEPWFARGLHIATILCAGISMLLTALVADRVGKGRVIIAAFISSSALLSVLAYGYAQHDFTYIVAGQLGLAVTLAPPSALMHAYLYELFEVRARYRCVSISHNIGSMCFSGSTPFFAMAAYKASGHELAPHAYFCAIIGLACLATYVLGRSQKRTRREAYHDCKTEPGISATISSS